VPGVMSGMSGVVLLVSTEAFSSRFAAFAGSVSGATDGAWPPSADRRAPASPCPFDPTRPDPDCVVRPHVASTAGRSIRNRPAFLYRVIQEGLGDIAPTDAMEAPNEPAPDQVGAEADE